MSAIVLRLERPPELRLDLRDIQPSALAAGTPIEVARLPVRHGNETVELGDFFRVGASAIDAGAPELRLEGDLSRCDGIGWKLADARIVVEGSVGDYVGASMTSGEVVVDGDAGLFAGCAIAGGRLIVRGNVDDFAASALPGDMEGMRGGIVVVHGHAGARFGDRMRRGTAIVAGDVGAFAGSRIVAGTIAIGGAAGAHPGFGMRRGTLVFAGAAPQPDVTFVASPVPVAVIWQLLARDLERFGGSFAGLARREPRRYVGDLCVNGIGEMLVAG